MWNTDKPKKKGWYIITVNASKQRRATSCAYWTGTYWTQFEESEESGKYLEVIALAWLPLPEPYTE